MFAGHVGAGLAIARLEPRVNVGVFITAALLLDILLWGFVMLGWESVSIPADFARSRQPLFTFPYSHSFVASLGWAVVTGVVAWLACARRLAPRWPGAALIAVAVFSHWLLDLLVHRPELPFAGAGSQTFGLALWDHLPAALATETAILAFGLGVFLRRRSLSRARSLALGALSLVVLALTILGMTLDAQPPSPGVLVATSFGSTVVTCALASLLGTRRG